MDAFGHAHRAEASTHGVAKFAPVACAGILLTEELDALTKALAKPARRWSHRRRLQGLDKLTVLESLSEKVDQMVVAAASPTPSSRPSARTSASRCARTIWCRPRRRSLRK